MGLDATLRLWSLSGPGTPEFECPRYGRVVLQSDRVGDIIIVDGAAEEEWPGGGRIKLASGEYVGGVLGIRFYWAIKIPRCDRVVAMRLAQVWQEMAFGAEVRFTPWDQAPWFTMSVVNDGEFPIRHVDDRRIVGMPITLKLMSKRLWNQFPLPPTGHHANDPDTSVQLVGRILS